MVLSRILSLTPPNFRNYSVLTSFVKSRPTNLQLEMVTGADPRVVDFYKHTWVREHPALRSAQPLDAEELTNFLSTSLSAQHTTLLTSLEGGAVVAAASGGPLTYNSVDELKKYADTLKDPRTQRLVHLRAAVTAESALLDNLRLPALWQLHFLATTPHMRRLGLARFLLTRHRRLAARAGFGVVCIQCFSEAMARTLVKDGYHTVPGRSLNSYKDTAGNPWVDDQSQDVRVMTLYKFVHSNKSDVTWLS